MSRFDAVEAYRRAYLIRATELEIAKRYNPNPDDLSESPMKTPCHLSIGQETVAVGVAMACPEAHVWLTHRTHAPYLAFGGDLNAMVAELYGRSTGCAGGIGGSMHLHDAGAGVMGGSAIVGSSVSLAVGSGLAAKLQGSERLTVAWCGDAVPETGQFWEALNFAALHELKILFVIEDNGLSTATPKEQRQASGWTDGGDGWLHFGMFHELWRTDLPLHYIEAADDSFTAVYDEALRMAGGAPAILRIPTTRFYEHVGPNRDDWRDVDESNDPVKALRNVLHPTDALGIQVTVNAQVAAAFEFAEESPWPEVSRSD